MSGEEMLDQKVWAVVGANDNHDKFGYKIYKKLKDRGYTVYPVNPNYTEIEGDQCYPDLKSLPQKPQVIDMVVSPKRGAAVLEEASSLGINQIWFQPGTYDKNIEELVRQKGLNGFNGCVLIALG